jgi:hypothetical protein
MGILPVSQVVSYHERSATGIHCPS